MPPTINSGYIPQRGLGLWFDVHILEGDVAGLIGGETTKFREGLDSAGRFAFEGWFEVDESLGCVGYGDGSIDDDDDCVSVGGVIERRAEGDHLFYRMHTSCTVKEHHDMTRNRRQHITQQPKHTHSPFLTSSLDSAPYSSTNATRNN